jgi:hypothetical protein
MNDRRGNDELYESSRQQNITTESRSSNVFVSKGIRTRNVHSTHLSRRSTFAVVAHGLYSLTRKAPLHKLDRLARIGFPLLFIICNCIYWYIFAFYTSE